MIRHDATLGLSAVIRTRVKPKYRALPGSGGEAKFHTLAVAQTDVCHSRYVRLPLRETYLAYGVIGNNLEPSARLGQAKTYSVGLYRAPACDLAPRQNIVG